MRCPHCQVDLQVRRTTDGILYHCASCAGEALTMAMVRRRLAQEAANAIWRGARGAGGASATGAACPTCARPMAQVTWGEGPAALTLDGCESCAVVWFDAAELERLPARPRSVPTTRPLRPVQAEAQAAMMIDAAAQAGAFADPFGDDVEGSSGREGVLARVGRLPWLGLTLGVLLLVIHLWTMLSRDWVFGTDRRARYLELVERYAFDPADPWRQGGLTLVSSFAVSPESRYAWALCFALVLAGYLLERRLGRLRFLGVMALGHGAALAAYAWAGLPRGAGLLGASAAVAALFGWAAVVLGRAYMNARRLTGRWWLGWHAHGASAGATVALFFGVWFLFLAIASVLTPWDDLVFRIFRWPGHGRTTPASFVGGLVGLVLGGLTLWRVGTGPTPGSDESRANG